MGEAVEEKFEPPEAFLFLLDQLGLPNNANQAGRVGNRVL